mmetsp:Transcript_10125/g.14737  ORF Transcript_10125/g.14737 Transcript_10125/m.14737 type:complete len:463 (-) Transcript_10125:59-1447(-)
MLSFLLLTLALAIINGEEVRPSMVRPSIINGEEVDPDVYPWFGRMTLTDSGMPDNWGGCGGSLVAAEYVLTAAHCVDGRTDELKSNGGFQIGALCAPYGPNKGDNCDQKVESFGISKITKHPDWDENTFSNNFALVRLDGTSSISPVGMDNGNISPAYENMSSKTNLWPIGFGKTETGSVSTKLLHVNVNYVKQETCNTNYEDNYGYDDSTDRIFDSMMCAADTDQDACQGDSGGPLFDSENKALVGVTSWGNGCAEAGFPGVYARISEEIVWIKSVICGAHGNPKPTFCEPIEGPTVSPTTEAPTVTPGPHCIDSPYKAEVKIAGDGTKILLSCEDIDVSLSNPKTCQADGKLATHCPLSCNTCDQMTVDSKLTYYDDAKGKTTRCKGLQGLSEVKREKRCRKDEKLRKTCRATCNYSTGEQACEGHGYNEDECANIGKSSCCQWDDGQCWSAIFQDECVM